MQPKKYVLQLAHSVTFGSALALTQLFATDFFINTDIMYIENSPIIACQCNHLKIWGQLDKNVLDRTPNIKYGYVFYQLLEALQYSRYNVIGLQYMHIYLLLA